MNERVLPARERKRLPRALVAWVCVMITRMCVIIADGDSQERPVHAGQGGCQLIQRDNVQSCLHQAGETAQQLPGCSAEASISCSACSSMSIEHPSELKLKGLTLLSVLW